MSPCLASSPAPAEASAFKSPLRAFVADDICSGAPSEEVYADAQVRLVQWRRDLVSSASYEAQQGIRELRHEQEHVKDLRSDLAGVRGLVEAASHLKAGGARLAEVVYNSTEAASARADAVAGLRDELREQSETHRQDLRQYEEAIAQQQAAADTQHTEALKLVNTYADRLGLAISRVAPQTVRMAFSLLDEAKPLQEFSFTLGLACAEEAKGAESYRVCECVPEVPNLPKLVAELNADAFSATALPRFVCSMRCAFVKSAGAARAA